ncbi:MFS transporter [Simkania sp.]|uniref:MFS transporter n=1 Tax=Simkania sp. TaxID=34094 RepID=UPI003B527957
MSNARKWWALIGLGLASSFVFTELVMVAVILGTIQVHLEASYIQLQWILNIYVLTTAVFMITMGRFGDLFGNRTMALLGMVGFGISSFFAGISPNPEWMIVSRAFQGIFGALIIPCTLALVNKIFPDEQKGRVIGMWNALAMLGIAIAPVLATVLHAIGSWRWIFFIHVPFMLICLIILVFTIRDELPKQEKQPIDWWGFLFLTVGTSAIVTAVTQGFIWGWTSPSTLLLLVLGAVSIVLWIMTEMTQKNPIVNFSWFANKTFASCVSIAIVATSCGVVLLFLLPLYLHNILNFNFIHVGLYLFAMTLPTAIFSPLGGVLTDKGGHRLPIYIGTFAMIVSLYLFTHFTIQTPVWFFLLAFILFGTSWGLIMGPIKAGVLSSLPHRMAGVGTGTLLSFEHLGAAVILAPMGTIFRRSAHLFLKENLSQESVQLSHTDSLYVQSLLSHPLKIKEELQYLGPKLKETIIPIFKGAFVHGFQNVSWVIFAISIFGLLLFAMLKKRKA